VHKSLDVKNIWSRPTHAKPAALCCLFPQVKRAEIEVSFLTACGSGVSKGSLSFVFLCIKFSWYTLLLHPLSFVVYFHRPSAPRLRLRSLPRLEVETTRPTISTVYFSVYQFT